MERYQIVAALVAKVKEKKPLHQVDDAVVRNAVEKFSLGNLIQYTDEKQLLRSAVVKDIVSAARDELNRVYGQFWSEEMTLEGQKSSV